MAQIYNEMRVIRYQADLGQLDVVWYDSGGGPIGDQTVLQRSHKIPIEAEDNNWTRTQLRDHWLLEVEDVADIPQWAIDEGDHSDIQYKPVPIIVV